MILEGFPGLDSFLLLFNCNKVNLTMKKFT
jgi:hypothetical protein